MSGRTWPQPVTALLAAGRLEQVPSDVRAARVRLARAQHKLAVARTVADVDVEVAYVTAYDAMRIALTAHMLAVGLRVPARPRAHEAVGEYGRAMGLSDHAAEFQRIRRRRNKAEYDDIVVGRADLDTDLVHVDAIVAAVTLTLVDL